MHSKRPPSNDQLTQKVSCHHERHMTGIVLKVYNLFWRLGKQSEDGTVSLTNRRIAEMVNARHAGSKRAGGYISRVKTCLVREGWLEQLGRRQNPHTGCWVGARYRPISHAEWVERQIAKTGAHPCAKGVRTVTVRTSVCASTRSRGYTSLRTPRYSTVRTGMCAQSVDPNSADSFQGAATPRTEEQASRSDSAATNLFEVGRGFPPSKPSPGREERPLTETEAEIAYQLKVTGKHVTAFRERFPTLWLRRSLMHKFAFELCGYPFDEDDPVLGEEFCWAMEDVLLEILENRTIPTKSVFCDRVLEICRSANAAERDRYLWPPSFEQYRDRVRLEEQLSEPFAMLLAHPHSAGSMAKRFLAVT